MDANIMQVWLDKLAIAEALNKYPIALDRLDRDVLLSLGSAESHVSFDGMFEGSWPAFVDWVIPAHKSLLAHNHRITNTLIEIDGDAARSDTYVTATLLVPQQTGEVDERHIHARYLDKWVRCSGRWLIAERRLERNIRRTTRLSAAEFKQRYVIEDRRL